MLSDEKLEYLAVIDGISLEDERKKYLDARREWTEDMKKVGLEDQYGDEYFDKVFLEVLQGYQRKHNGPYK